MKKFTYILWTLCLLFASIIASLVIPDLVSQPNWFAFFLGIGVALGTGAAWVPWIKTTFYLIVSKYA